MPPGDRAESAESGTDAEFATLFQQEYPALVRSMYLIVHDREHARDIAQDAFIQLFTRWRRVSRYERPDAWVRRVAIRMAVRAIRRDRLRHRLEQDVEVVPAGGAVDIDLMRAIAKLPAAQRAAVVLFYLEDRSVADVADILACSEVTAKVHLHRARKRLAELLGDDESWEEAVHAT